MKYKNIYNIYNPFIDTKNGGHDYYINANTPEQAVKLFINNQKYNGLNEQEFLKYVKDGAIQINKLYVI